MTNKERTKQHFIDIGEWQKFEKPVMHHKDPSWRHNDPERYNQWRVEDIIVMEDSEHKSLHNSGENSHRWGKPGTNLGRKFSESWCQHISENHADMRGENNPMYGKHMSEEAKQKSRVKHSKPIKVTNLLTGEVREFPTAKCDECAEYLGYKNSQCCTSKVNIAIKNDNGIIRKGPSRKTYDAFKVEYIKEGSVNKLE